MGGGGGGGGTTTVSAAENRAASMVTIHEMPTARACSYCSVGEGAACATTCLSALNLHLKQSLFQTLQYCQNLHVLQLLRVVQGQA